MQDLDKNLVCDYKRYNFPFRLYHCTRHGVYVWRESKYELFDLGKRLNQATKIEDLEPKVIQRFAESHTYMPTLSDYKPVKMECPYCEVGYEKKTEWRQHYGYLTPDTKDKDIFCPCCIALIPIEKARASPFGRGLMNKMDNVKTVLRFLASLEKDETGRASKTGPQISEALDMFPRDVNDSIELARRRGWVLWVATIGRRPYTFEEVEISPEGRLWIEKPSHLFSRTF